MNAQGILTRIEQDAREAAATLLREAQLKAAEIRATSEKKIEAQREAAIAQAKLDGTALADRMDRMAKLDARKELLASKRSVLDQAFARALDLMAAMPEDQARAFGQAMLLEAATGDETLIADEASAWCDERFVNDGNAALKAAGKPGAIRLSSEKRRLGGGFVLERGGMEINCSYPAALEAKRMDIEADIAAKLFD